MFCNKCGNEVSPNQEFCNKCGNRLIYNNLNYNMHNKSNNKNIVIPIVIVTLIVILIFAGIIYYLILENQNKYFIDDSIANKNNIGQTINDSQTQTNNKDTKKGKYSTDIITDNVYSGISINSIDDAYKLISQDSLEQKKEDYPEEIIKIENNIIDDCSVTAVNLKEIDVEFAKELENVMKKIYEDYPEAKGYLTNLTLTNMDMTQNGVIALFMPIFTFATSKTDTTRPWVIKTQIQLNSKYFLNPERINISVQASSKAGHFPPNATKYSSVAHEMGHYLSFIALLKHYYTDEIIVVEDNQMQNYYDICRDFTKGDFSKEILEEAYRNYLNNNGNMEFDEWRGQISGYALAKDDLGDYIYDETIAEAFHDVYLNDNNANEASKYIVEVLKKYIGG